jgi:exo-1,4-beta-D-glucosaminidase
MQAAYAKPQSAADYERMANTMEYDSERAMYEAYSKNKYTSTGVIQWMLNNAWPSMIWHLYDYYLDTGGGYFGAKKACEPLHIQYAYDDRAIDIVNSTYSEAAPLKAQVHVYGINWNELYTATSTVTASPDSSQRVFTIPAALYSGPERILFVDLSLNDASGRAVSHNFYWVPTTLTTFDWEGTDYTHTPASHHEDLTALAHLPAAQVDAHAEIASGVHGREIRLHLANKSNVLAFQVRGAVRTASGGLIAPVLWSDNWIELKPGESTTLTAQLPATGSDAPTVQIDGWNVAPVSLTPTTAVAAR